MLLPDDLIIGNNCSKRMISVHKKYKSSVIASMIVKKNNVSRWGIFKIKHKLSNNNFVIKDVNYVLEKNYIELLNKKEIDENELQQHVAKYNNVVKEMKIKWVALKD